MWPGFCLTNTNTSTSSRSIVLLYFMLICFFDWYLVTFYYFNVLALVWRTAFEFLLILFAFLLTFVAMFSEMFRKTSCWKSLKYLMNFLLRKKKKRQYFPPTPMPAHTSNETPFERRNNRDEWRLSSVEAAKKKKQI